MSEAERARTGGRILVDALRGHGVDLIFGVPGESYLPVLDALYDLGDDGAPARGAPAHGTAVPRFVTCRHEVGAAFMAEAYGKLTGRPGVALVTRGPGACNASIGVHTAFQDSSPMVLLVGQVPRDMADREAFQEVDYRAMFAPLAKLALQVEAPARLPELIAHAFRTAASGRPGPVVVALPEDMLSETASVADRAAYQAVRPHPAASDMAALRARLEQAERPVMIVGGGGWSAGACADLEAFVAATGLPTAASFRCMDLLNNDHPLYIGDVAIGISPSLGKRVGDADLIVAVGCRLGEITTQGYTLLDTPRQRLVHVHADPTEPGRVFEADLAINAGMAGFAAAARALVPVDGARWADWAAAARADYEAWQQPGPCPGKLDLGVAMVGLRDFLPPDAIITNDAGNFAGWINRFHRFRTYRSQLGPTNGAMGYAVPAAIAAKLARPDVPVLGFVGDGGVMMTGQELATALQHGVAVVIVVVNNGMYGTIRMHQETHYPGRVIGTALDNPDFVAWARSFGAHGELVETTDQFVPAVERALAAGKAAVLELRLDPEAITTRTTLTALRARSSQRQA